MVNLYYFASKEDNYIKTRVRCATHSYSNKLLQYTANPALSAKSCNINQCPSGNLLHFVMQLKTNCIPQCTWDFRVIALFRQLQKKRFSKEPLAKHSDKTKHIFKCQVIITHINVANKCIVYLSMCLFFAMCVWLSLASIKHFKRFYQQRNS